MQLTAWVSGTITDAAGDIYHASGHFTDDGVLDQRPPMNDLRFEGSGTFVLAGRGGVILGEATLRAVTAPSELQLAFTDIKVCTTR